MFWKRSPRVLLVLLVAAGLGFTDAVPRPENAGGDSVADTYRSVAEQLIRAATATKFGWDRLAELSDTFGSRLSGSQGLERAILWAAAEMKKDGLENVRIEKVLVPKWVRGVESLEMVQPSRQPIVMLGLGGSIATPPEGIEAEVLVVTSFLDLKRRARSVRGRIVLYNVPYTHYGETITYRSNGASMAAQFGAVAALVRSVGPAGLRTPHTGALRYTDDAPKIPAAAITVEDTLKLQRMQDRGVRPVVRLKMNARFLPDAESANVVGEIPGRENPEEIVLIGGHFDSWDVGTGASDDGVGCIVTWEAARLIQMLQLRPRRTVRLVLWTNEENGGRGGVAYRDKYEAEARNHILAIESDSGVFPPATFGFTGSEAARATIGQIASLLGELGMERVGSSGGGADIGPIVEAGNVPAMSLNGETSRYFTIHHTEADTVDRIAPEEVARAAAAIAVMTYIVAEMPEPLPK